MKLISRSFLPLVLKGAGMGAANVIPGVSGGTIALITGIYERLIQAIKSIDIKAARLLFSGKFNELSEHINLPFLIPVFIGIGGSILTLAKVLQYLFETHAVLLWAFFFGLILASVIFVGRTIERWDVSTIGAIVVGTGIAVGISSLNPASENTGSLYLVICGVVAISSMILPGLSGSFVLTLLGNYMLVLSSITELNMGILLPFAVGCVVGLLAFSHVLAWVFQRFRDITIALLTGFILGSLMILWPWKNEQYLMDEMGELILRKGEKLISGYEWLVPEINGYNAMALALVVVGIVSIWLIERFAEKQTA